LSNESAKVGGELHDVVIVGGGAAGIATAASLLKRRPDLDILVIEPQTKHYYQPGWTMVGAGIFSATSTERDEADFMPRGVRWLKCAAAAFAPEANASTTASVSLIACSSRRLASSSIGAPSKAFPRR
jgi:sulfide:quinone oxidoreductase